MAYALDIQALCKIYDDQFEALKGIDLRVESGDFFALLGPNGAGKSTTLGIVSSLINKTSGKVSVFGADLDSQREDVKRQLGVVPQEFNFNYFEKVEDILRYQAGFYGLSYKEAQPRIEKYLKALDLWDKKDQVSRRLSGGMKRRLMIARALIHEPKLLILDEPTAGVDIELRRSMWEFLSELNKRGTTIILTTHYLEEAESLCRNIAIIDNGHIVKNSSTRELLAELDKQTFVLDLKNNISTLPDLSVPARQVDSHCLEVDLTRDENLNDVVQMLTKQSLMVMSIRPKANRLEELFVNLIAEAGEAANSLQQSEDAKVKTDTPTANG